MKTWPIDIDPTCQMKWTWSTLYMTNSASASCHRTTQYKFDLNSFDDFHNLPEKIRDRELMLDGVWPGNGCEYCKKIEESGGYSDRNFNSTLNNVTPDEVLSNPQATSVVPKIVEVYFDNTCDLKCTYCGQHFSSLWQSENKKHGSFKIGTLHIDNDYEVSANRRKYVDKFWIWWDQHYSQVTHFHFLGGEPFYQKEFDEFVNFISTHNNPDLIINITTNLNCDIDRLRDKIKTFEELTKNKQIKTLQIVASLDCWGPQQEHIRFPLHLERWEKNFEYLVDQPWLLLNINSTISSLSIKHMPELMLKINQWRLKHEVYHSFMTVQEENPLCPDFLGGDVFREDFQKIILIMEQDVSTNNFKDNFITYMKGIATQIASTKVNKPRMFELYSYLNELDRRRGTDWKILYPWLVDEFTKNSVQSMYNEFNNKNYYEILNAHEDSWPMVIVKAFKTLQTNETDRFKLNLYQTAYDVLIDPDKRKKYDLTLKGN